MIRGVDIDGEVRDIDAAELLPYLKDMSGDEQEAFLAECSDDEAAELDAAYAAEQGPETLTGPSPLEEFERLEAQARHVRDTEGAFDYGLGELEREIGRKLTVREITAVQTRAAVQAQMTMEKPDVRRAFERYYEEQGEEPYIVDSSRVGSAADSARMTRYMAERARDLEALAPAEPEPEPVERPEFPDTQQGRVDEARWMADEVRRRDAAGEEPERVEQPEDMATASADQVARWMTQQVNDMQEEAA